MSFISAFTAPNKTWSLGDWFSAVGVRSNEEVAEIANQLYPADDPWKSNRIAEWHTHKLKERERTLKMLAVLCEIARRNHSEVFTTGYIEEHANIFLRSAACKHEFRELDDNELWQLFIHEGKPDFDTSSDNLTSLRSKVQPRPPNSHTTLFGRKQDIERVHQALALRPLAVIDGVGGEGKTALAWFAALNAYENGRFTNFDWTTDKRYFVDIHGEIRDLPNSETDEDFLERILKSMARRFGWSRDFAGAFGDRLLNKCADRLRAGHYLIVVDNLETVQASDKLVRQLLDMLTPRRSAELVASRVLLTSRHIVDDPHCAEIPITGINIEAGKNYLRYLEQTWLQREVLSDSQCVLLQETANGNPLLLQIAMRRFTLTPNQDTFESIVASLQSGTHKVFSSLFDPLIDFLSTDAVILAQIAAHESLVSPIMKRSDLEIEWYQQWADQPGSRHTEHFLAVLAELLRNRILSSADNTYTMHPLIRAHILGK